MYNQLRALKNARSFFANHRSIFLKSARIKYIIKSVHLNRNAHAGYSMAEAKLKHQEQQEVYYVCSK